MLAALWLGFSAGAAEALGAEDDNFVPGFGMLFGKGVTENGADSKRFGFSSRRLKEDDRIGSLALIGEEHFEGIEIDILDPALSRNEVEIHYQSVFFEVKRYFSLGSLIHYYWGLRGGYTRIRGRIRPTDGRAGKDFEVDQIAPLALLALPLALENPGFLLLAFTDGTSLGFTLDIVPNRVWLDYGVAAVVIPGYRDTFVAIDESINVTQTLQLLIVF